MCRSGCRRRRMDERVLAELLLLLLLEVTVACQGPMENLVRLEVDAAPAAWGRGCADLATELALRAGTSCRGAVLKVLKRADAELHAGC